MSGHSKWSTIKRAKGIKDAKRGQAFTKAASAITIAVKEGGGDDPISNFKLRLAVDQARAVNMPKANIDRAIERGLGKSGVSSIESVVYEGYAPGKVALIIEAVTDNKNRTTPEVRGAMEKNGGTFATPGAVSWMFTDSGLVTVIKNGKTFDDIFEIAVESGADDVEDGGDLVEVFTKPNEVEKVKNVLITQGMIVKGTEITKRPTITTPIVDEVVASKVLKIIDAIEEIDDVQKVYANFDIPDELLAKISP